jgi:GNAT superfamily N-acetyltransferase
MEDHAGNGYWYVNRVLVQPESNRSKGIGSRMLQELLAQAKALDVGMERATTKVRVTPGGYNEDHERQKRFYAKNGFIDVENGMIWES